MHKEKVSRREIGAFTAVRRVSRGHKILPPNPASTEPRPAYSRRPISYQQLDSLGHGIKVSPCNGTVFAIATAVGVAEAAGVEMQK